MDKSVSDHNESDGISAETATNIVELLSRIFKLTSYYPEGHRLLEKAVTLFIQKLRDVAPPGDTVYFRLTEKSIFFNEQPVDPESVLAEDLRRFIFALGQKTIEMDTNLYSEHLYTFVEKMLKWRLRAEKGGAFSHFFMDNLPETIRFDDQEFAVDSSVQVDEQQDDEGRGVEEICLKLYKQGLSEEEVGKCRKLLQQIARSPAANNSYASEFTNATWHEAETTLQQLARGELNPDLFFSTRTDKESSAGVNALSAIFSSIGRGLADENSNRAIELLLSSIKKDSATQLAAKKRSKTKKSIRPARPRAKISSIEKYIEVNSVPPRLLKSLTKGDRSEELSVCLQVFNLSLDEVLRSEVSQRLRSIVLQQMTGREKTVLINAMTDFAEKGQTEIFFHLLKDVVLALRETGREQGMIFLQELQDECAKDKRGLCWPLIVNELLVVGGEGGGEVFEGFVKRASNTSEKGMHAMQIYLEELDAFSKGTVAETVFCSSWKFAYPLFSFLLSTSLGNVLAEKVLTAIKKRPQDDFMEAICPLLDLETEGHFDFFRDYLKQVTAGEPPLSLKMAGGDIVLDYLKKLSAARDGLEEAERILEIDDLYHTMAAAAALEEVLHAKKMLVLPLWPRSCRRAARKTLSRVKKRKLIA